MSLDCRKEAEHPDSTQTCGEQANSTQKLSGLAGNGNLEYNIPFSICLSKSVQVNRSVSLSVNKKNQSILLDLFSFIVLLFERGSFYRPWPWPNILERLYWWFLKPPLKSSGLDFLLRAFLSGSISWSFFVLVLFWSNVGLLCFLPASFGVLGFVSCSVSLFLSPLLWCDSRQPRCL